MNCGYFFNQIQSQQISPRRDMLARYPVISVYRDLGLRDPGLFSVNSASDLGLYGSDVAVISAYIHNNDVAQRFSSTYCAYLGSFVSYPIKCSALSKLKLSAVEPNDWSHNIMCSWRHYIDRLKAKKVKYFVAYT